MKIIIINTSDKTGGAAIAAKRLIQSLKKKNIDVSMLVQEKETNSQTVYSTTNSKIKKLLNLYRFAFERFLFYLKENNKSVRFAFSIGNIGEDISKNKLLTDADIIHLHWINNSFLSLKSLKKIFALNKPIVWTFHDMWAFTGGCHYAGDCENYKTECKNCPFLKKPHKNDLSKRIWNLKKKAYINTELNIVTCSNWLKEVTSESALLKDENIIAIQNPIDTDTFKPTNKSSSKQKLNINTNKKLVLFGAMNINDKRKGSGYLIKALEYIFKEHQDLKERIALVIFGKNKTPFNTTFETINLSFINKEEDIVNAYNACDIFVTPSIEDNLPNTIVEAHSCGLPVVAFNATGMTEMIEHKKNGYLASYKSPEDLAKGIIWTLFESDYNELANSARNKALKTYSEDISASKYIELYKSLINNNEQS